MKFIFLSLIAGVVFCPIIALIGVYVICRKCTLNHVKSFGFAADVTTAILFITVPLAVHSLWGVAVFFPTILLALVIAIVFTYIDWRTTKEIEVMPLLKKIWRIYFILLSTSYFIVWIAGLTQNIIEYVAFA